MKNPFNHPAWIDISLMLGRATLGVYMLMAGWKHMELNGGGISGFVKGPFMAMKPEWLPDSIAQPYGYILPILQLVCGLGMILGLFSRLCAGIITIILISISIAVISKNGITDERTGLIPHSIVFAAMSMILAVVGSGRLALDPLYFSGGGDGGGKKK